MGYVVVVMSVDWFLKERLKHKSSVVEAAYLDTGRGKQ
jgi:hypothetical protein